MNRMKAPTVSPALKIATLIAFSCYARPIVLAATPSAMPVPAAGGQLLLPVSFADSAEAGMLRSAYHILATGDHDYRGHRAKAMHAVESAGKLLGMNLAEDLKDKSPQKLSDEKLREAQGLINQVLASAEVKGQSKVVKHLTAAVDQINTALHIR